MPPVTQAEVRRRPVTPSDEPLLRAIYAATREEELAALSWSVHQREAFLELQFQAQTRDYTRRFPTSRHEIVLVDDEPVGRVWTNADQAELRLLDISLLTPWRGRGVGTVLLQSLQAEARAHELALRQTVLVDNLAAQRLYRRLRFVETDRTGTHLLMEWRPEH